MRRKLKQMEKGLTKNRKFWEELELVKPASFLMFQY
jgi:hypothetical protein